MLFVKSVTLRLYNVIVDKSIRLFYIFYSIPSVDHLFKFQEYFEYFHISQNNLQAGKLSNKKGRFCHLHDLCTLQFGTVVVDACV